MGGQFHEANEGNCSVGVCVRPPVLDAALVSRKSVYLLIDKESIRRWKV